MRLVALRLVKHTAGSIHPGQSFSADPAYAQQLIDAGAATPEEQYASAPWSGEGYWRVQPEWAGESVAILGGGPGLTREQIDQLGRTDVRIIAINNAGELAPWADILYFCDARWYQWHKEKAAAFEGRRVTLENLALQRELEVRSLRDYGVLGFAPRSDGVCNGRNSGYQALQLAAWLGAARVLLLGFDMRQVEGRMHWHPEHPVATPANIFQGWLDCFEQLAPELEKRGCKVINCTPGSALKVFPHMTLAAALGLEPPAPSEAEVAANDRYLASLAAAPIYRPQPIEYPPAPPPSIEEEKPEPAPEAGFFTPEPGGTFGGAGASGSWPAETAAPEAAAPAPAAPDTSSPSPGAD